MSTNDKVRPMHHHRTDPTKINASPYANLDFTRRAAEIARPPMVYGVLEIRLRLPVDGGWGVELDGDLAPRGVRVRVDLGTARQSDITDDRLLSNLAWLVAEASSVEIVGTVPRAIAYLARKLPEHFRALDTADAECSR